ncbi:Acyl-CoA synthetase (AMP-forming)/AMP-acid ligase II [Ruegeria halocynthiae]|uniref:Acyl-CoA synthetase (AMP-forming)/AMP-acid ligase II n=1 Tax=Ruegeria halocynthiae TaxID=985054 RepID=A0A1H3E331_9RHOB|nr:AMP-binding protein [Ruegeria halocynthiae]SDX72304.1 Acyl-CoA synthetase (AMP-forming)/AMP-acid ligase II [Ruegeria halocynthiae]
MKGSNLYRLLADNLNENADKVALYDARRSISYSELISEADVVARYLTSIGVGPGDRVVVHLRKSIEEVVAMFGAAKIGAVVANVHFQWTTEQLLYVAKDSGSSAIIVGKSAQKGLANRTLPEDVRGVLVFDNKFYLAGSQEDGSNQDKPEKAEEFNAAAEDLAMIIYTSGSTGMPKGVMLSHRNILIGAETVIEYLNLNRNDRLLSVLPYSFDAGLNQLTTMLMVGGSVVHQPVIMPAEIVKSIQAHEVTGFAGVPPLWNQIVRLLRKSPEALNSLRLITNTGGKIPIDILESMSETFPKVKIYLMYGLTEAFRSTYLLPEKFQKKLGAIGQPVPNSQVFVIKHGEGLAGPGEQGELVHAGPLVSLGYWRQPALTQKKIRPCPELIDVIGDTPVVYSGDIVRVDDDGDLWFVSRADDLIKTSGFRLSPTEVEDLVSLSGLVCDVVAFGVEDDDLGQIVHLAVTEADGFSSAALLTHCKKVMPGYMVPRHVCVWPGQMPRTASGKLDRTTIIANAQINS